MTKWLLWLFVATTGQVVASGHTLRSKMAAAANAAPKMPVLLRSRGGTDSSPRLAKHRLRLGSVFLSQKVPRSPSGPAPVVSVTNTTAQPKLVLTSYTPWVNDFLIYLRNLGQENKVDAQPKVHNTDHLQSRITRYQDYEYEKDNLAGWTKAVTSRNKPIDTEAEVVSPPVLPSFDREAFMRYLVDNKGFSEEDLSFLHTRLDYGFAEIDAELSKMRSMERSQVQLCISIGGENAGSLVRIHGLAWLVVVALL